MQVKASKCPIRGVIFDLDGTLVDSRLNFVAMRAETGCPPDTGLLEFIASLTTAAQRDRAQQIVHRHEMAGAALATWMPGARALLTALAKSKLPLGIVTRNSRPAATHTLQSLAAPTLDLITREDAAPKPDPDGLLQLARRWRLEPEHLVYIGDFRFDIEAATAAGMRSALFAQSGNASYAHLANKVFHHFDELAPWLLDATD